MSVSLTEAAVRARRKTVTRRVGWWTDRRGRRLLQVGDRLALCRQVMGRRGEPLVRVADVMITSVTRQPLRDITADDVALEGLAPMTPPEFIDFFCRTHKGCTPETTVTRIEWRYLDDDSATTIH
jgi:hypothetical protein